jgi:hypothetical protein
VSRPYVDDPEVVETATVPEDDGPPQYAQSLEDRVAARRKQLDEETFEVFEVPGWNDILGVKLRLQGFEEGRKIAKQHAKVRPETLRELYVVCDTIVQCTVGLVEFNEDGSWTDSQHDWVSLVQRLVERKAIDVDDSLQMTPRRALLALVGDKRIPNLYVEWQQWVAGARPHVDQEVVGDFAKTR